MDTDADTLPRLRTRYRLISLIARGGTAEVYLAHDDLLGRDVAIKVFSATAADVIDLHRQEDEVNVLARLSHPNVVTLLDAAVDRSDPAGPRVYYVMEYVDGADLKRRLESITFVPRQIAQLGFSAATALAYIHERGIVHRDVKPANILITMDEDGSRVVSKLGDFGVASFGPSGPIGDDELVTGTVAYLSPEQATGAAVGPETDVYSLGLVLLQCFTGVLAFPGRARESAIARLTADPVIPSSVPVDWVRLLSAMTSRVPGERPSMHDVALALKQKFVSESGRHRASAERLDALDAADARLTRMAAVAAAATGAPIALILDRRSGRSWYHHDLGTAGEALISRAVAERAVAEWAALEQAPVQPIANEYTAASSDWHRVAIEHGGAALGELLLGARPGETLTAPATRLADDLAAVLAIDLLAVKSPSARARRRAGAAPGSPTEPPGDETSPAALVAAA